MQNPDEEVIRILIVDDDEDDRELFIDTLKEFDFPHVIRGASGTVPLFELLKQGPLPHLIFLDINMPLPDGRECLKRLKSDPQFKDIPVIMYSGSSATRDIEDTYSAGAHYYMVKPHAHTNLPGSLRQAFNRDWRKPQQVPELSSFVIHLSFGG